MRANPSGEGGRTMRLAIDVMGGDHAPGAIVKGCVQAIEYLADDDRLLLVGQSEIVRELLTELGCDDPRLEIFHASEIIDMGESPTSAVRQKKDSSLVQMARLGSPKASPEERCDAVISAGNTGACVAAAQMNMKRLHGVHRPGIAVTIPAFHGPVVLCDAGANPEPRPLHLAQYASMASVFARATLGIERPRVALMNIGAEEGKGSELVRETRAMIRQMPDVNFIGFVEGRDFFDDKADVIITDGFVGNTVLKMAEGLAKSLFAAIAQEVLAADPALAAKFQPIVKQIYAKNDYHEHGGAPLLGVNGTCIIAHGSSEARTIKAAIRNTKAIVEAGVNDRILESMQKVEPA